METLQRTANRGSISTAEYEIDNSCKFEADNTEYLERDPSSAGDRQKFTTSMWVKRTELGQASTIFGVQPASSHSDTNTFQFGFMSDDKIQLGLQTYYVFNTNRLFRDTSAWYHIVVAFDTTQSTAANRIKLYVNGIQETAFDVEAYPNQNHSTGVNFTEPHRIGTLISNSWYFSGYISEVNHVDGSQLAPTAFGEFDTDSGIWKPKAYAGSYGTNGFYLDFADASDLGDDESGNGNDFTENNIAAADQATDTPTNNFATGNPLVPLKANTILTNGATNFKNVGTAGWAGFAPSIAVQSGKWYVEFTAAGATTMCGVGNVNDFLNSIYYGNWNTSIGFYGTAGLLFIDGATSGAGPNNTWSGSAYGNGSIVGIALDKDNGCVYMSVNGTFANSGDPTSGASKTGGVELTKGNSDYSASDYFYIGASQDINNGILQANYGGYTTDTPSSAATDANGYGTFEYAPPTGYYALCTQNLAEFG